MFQAGRKLATSSRGTSRGWVSFLFIGILGLTNHSQGDNIDEAKPVRLPWHINVSAEQFRDSYPLSASIFTCNDRDPPTRQISSVRQGSSIQSEKSLDICNLRSFRGTDGKQYKKIDFSIEMTVIGAALEFALMYQGKRIGHSEVQAQVET